VAPPQLIVIRQKIGTTNNSSCCIKTCGCLVQSLRTNQRQFFWLSHKCGVAGCGQQPRSPKAVLGARSILQKH